MNSLPIRRLLNAVQPNMARFLSSVKADIPSLNFEQLKTLLKQSKVMIVDVREPKEIISDGKIPDSVNIPLGELKSAFQLPEKEFSKKTSYAKPELVKSPLVLHCKMGKRALVGAKILKDLGYADVRVFPGGAKEWLEKSK